MKKIYLLIIVSFLSVIISCSKDGIIGGTSLSPPAWIIGTWKDSISTQISITFTSDDVIVWEQSVKDFYFGDTITEDIKTDSTYQLTAVSANATYRFERQAETTLKCTPSGVSELSGIGSVFLTKEAALRHRSNFLNKSHQ